MAYSPDQDRNCDSQNEENAASAGREKIRRKSPPNYARKRRPSAYNGIHLRRKKRFS
jgi:hypothetical protein